MPIYSDHGSYLTQSEAVTVTTNPPPPDIIHSLSVFYIPYAEVAPLALSHFNENHIIDPCDLWYMALAVMIGYTFTFKILNKTKLSGLERFTGLTP